MLYVDDLKTHPIDGDVVGNVSMNLVTTDIIAKLVGALLPLLAKKCHLDPAVMASPFITTIIDAVSLIILCTLSFSLLPA